MGEYPGPSLSDRPTKAQRAAHDAAFQEWAAKENARIAKQRAAFAANLGPARADLQRLMLDRAWELLDANECEVAGVERTFHDLRRTAATNLLIAGIPAPQVAMIMGWKQADVDDLQRLYVSRPAVVAAVLEQLAKGG